MTNHASFTKVVAGGLDFVVLMRESDAEVPTDQELERLLDRRLGVGGFGLVTVTPAVQQDSTGERYPAEPPKWRVGRVLASHAQAATPDAVLAAALALRHHQPALFDDAGVVPLASELGTLSVQATPGGMRLDLGRWSPGAGEALVRVKDLPVARPGERVNIFGTHLVVALASESELASADLTFEPFLGDAAESAGPSAIAGAAEEATLSLVVPAEPLVQDAVGRIRVRNYLIGHGEEPAVTSALAAAALATRGWAGPEAPHQWRVGTAQERAWVRMFPTEDGEHVSVTVSGGVVFSGVWVQR